MTEETKTPKYPEIGSKVWDYAIVAPREGEVINDANSGVSGISGVLCISGCSTANLWGPAECFHADELSAWRRYLADLRAEIVVAENNIERLEQARAAVSKAEGGTEQ